MREFFKEIKFEEKPDTQLYKVLEELVEAEQELISNNREKFLLEMIDVLHSATNVLYKAGYNDEEIYSAINDVYVKNKNRGYYFE